MYIRLFNKQENVIEKNIPSRDPRIDPWGIVPSNISPVTTLREKTFFRESGVFSRKFDAAKYNSRGCFRKFVLSKVSSREYLLS